LRPPTAPPSFPQLAVVVAAAAAAAAVAAAAAAAAAADATVAAAPTGLSKVACLLTCVVAMNRTDFEAL